MYRCFLNRDLLCVDKFGFGVSDGSDFGVRGAEVRGWFLGLGAGASDIPIPARHATVAARASAIQDRQP